MAIWVQFNHTLHFRSSVHCTIHWPVLHWVVQLSVVIYVARYTYTYTVCMSLPIIRMYHPKAILISDVASSFSGGIPCMCMEMHVVLSGQK